MMTVPGTAVRVVLSEYTLAAGTTPPATRFDWTLQDVGSPQLQLEVSGLDALIDRTKSAGYRFPSVGAKPIQRVRTIRVRDRSGRRPRGVRRAGRAIDVRHRTQREDATGRAGERDAAQRETRSSIHRTVTTARRSA